MTLVFCGLGLNPEDLTQRIHQQLKKADIVYLDGYTSFFSGMTRSSGSLKDQLSTILERPIILAERHLFEEESNNIIDLLTKGKKIVILVPGDPFSATTHVSIWEQAVKKGIPVSVFHNTSILSAAPSISGLHPYKFGRVATVTFPENPSQYPYEIVCANLTIDAHTLLLHDIDVPNHRFLVVDEALNYILQMEQKLGKSGGKISKDTPCIGLFSVGSSDCFVRAGKLSDVEQFDWSNVGPPQCTIICASLHPTELDSVRILHSATF